MKFGSLFSGIGGLDLGLERAGMTCVFQAESDPYAQRVLEKHWPNVFQYDDVRHVHGIDVGHIDLLCGGFPCQDVSVAGRGAGLDGARSGLWREFARIIEEVHPAWVLIENVPALRTRGLRTVLSDLHARGYDAEWNGVSAAAVGAPHLRDRLFIVAHAQCEFVRVESGRGCREVGTRALLTADPCEKGPATNAHGERKLRPGDRGRFEGWERPSNCGWWDSEPGVVRVADGVPNRVDRIRGLGNAVVPQVAEYVGRLILDASRRSISAP